MITAETETFIHQFTDDSLLRHVNCSKSVKAAEFLWDLKIFAAVTSSHDDQSELSAEHLL